MTLFEVVKTRVPEIAINTREDLVEKELTEVIALHLYSQGRITSGTAAKLIGISRIEFLQLAGKHQIPMYEYSEEELRNELQQI